MTLKEKIIQEVEEMPDDLLPELLAVMRLLKANHPSEAANSEFWQAYLASKKERMEVYRRLANS